MAETLLRSSEFNTRAFEQLKRILKRYENGMKVVVEEPGVYYLAYNTQEDQPADAGYLFAALVTRKSGLNLYLSALRTFPGFREFIPPRLMKYLSDDGLRFQFGNNVANLIDDVELIVRLSVGIL